MYYVYIIESIFKKYRYIGCTSNIQNRLLAHNSGTNQSTRNYRPYKLIYLERLDEKKKALKREKQLKSYKGGRALTNLISCWDGGAVNHNSL